MDKLDKLNIIKCYSLKGDKFFLFAHRTKIKRPVLMIGNNYGVIQVATFLSDSDVEIFCEWIDECLAINREAGE